LNVLTFFSVLAVFVSVFLYSYMEEFLQVFFSARLLLWWPNLGGTQAYETL